ncbi:LOW QUALITY PROTEIN: helicase-like transcription factor CHR28 [Curcuma longa]|uniref:LOW QUALITY PROTEIN: helicase-like transcription factor CHR28 n=1 Tax=Curcuma longa TaxID=136217 RepID=UPI003D9F8B11
MEEPQINSWESFGEENDPSFDENFTFDMEELETILDEKEPAQPPSSDEQSQITYEGLFQAKLDEYPLDADDIARTYTGLTESKECSGAVAPQWSTSDRIGVFLDCQKEINVGFSLGSKESHNYDFPTSNGIRHASEHAESKHTPDYPSSCLPPLNQEYDFSSRKNLVGSSRNSLMVRDLHNQQIQHVPSYNSDTVDERTLIMPHYAESRDGLYIDSGQKVFEQSRSHHCEPRAGDSYTMTTDFSVLTDAERNDDRRSTWRDSLFHDPYTYATPSLNYENLDDSKSMLNATEASGIMYNPCGSGYGTYGDSPIDGARNALYDQFPHPVFSHQKVKDENEEQLHPSQSLSRGSEVGLDTRVESVGSLLQGFLKSDTVRPLLDTCAEQNDSDDLSIESESSIDSSSYVSRKREPSSRNSISSDAELFVMNESGKLIPDALTHWQNKKQKISSMIGRDDQVQISHYPQSSLKHHDNDGLRWGSTTSYISVDDDADICILDDSRNSAYPPPPHPFYTSNPTVVEQSGFTETYLPRFGGIRQKDEDRLNIQLALQDLSQPKSEVSPPEGLLAVPLLRHQRIALHWMVQKETANPHCCGGILADDQGLGKTVSTIALILMERSPSPQLFPSAGNHDKFEPLNLDDDEEDEISKINEAKQLRICSSMMASGSKGREDQVMMSVKSRPAAGTLVVCPTSVLRQWAEELKTKVVGSANLSFLVYHGGNRTKDAHELAKYDVVLTTYAIVSMEVPKQPLADKDVEEKGNYDGLTESMIDKKRKEAPSSSRKCVKDGNVKAAARPLARVSWFRVILDEAQSIKNHRTQVARACWGLRAKRRWCLSGTPIQNAVDDLYSYFRFLRYDPFDAYKSFCSKIKNPISRDPSNGYKRLQLVLKTIMLRRTKGTLLDGKPVITLPPKTITLMKVDFSEEERTFYTRLEAESREQFKVYANEGTVKQNYVNILLMLLRLRQACDHRFLVNGYGSDSMEKSSIETARKLPKEKQKDLLSCLEACLAICTICNDPPEDAVVTICGHVFCNQCIREHLNGDDNICPSADCKVRLNAVSVFSRSTIVSSIGEMTGEVCNSNGCSSGISDATTNGNSYSSKVKAALDILQSLPRSQCSLPDCNSSKLKEGHGSMQNGVNAVSQQCSVNANEGNKSKPNCQHSEKAIVFSQWTKMLDLLEVPLQKSSIQYRRLDGTMSVAAREKAIKDFNNLPEVTVMIMSLKAASLGLNLVVACHVLLLDLWWNPTTEDQAIDRAHRIGQSRPVTVSRLTVKDTVEDRILALQEKKREMVASAFGEDESGSRQTRLTVEDLNYLFMV